MADLADVLLKHWEEQRAQARQSETQRATLTNMIIVISAAGFGFVAQHGLKGSALVVTLALLAVGLYGALATAKFYERFKYHNTQARVFAEKLEELFPELKMQETFSIARSRHDDRYKILPHIRLHNIWTALHLAITLAGLIMSLVIFF